MASGSSDASGTSLFGIGGTSSALAIWGEPAIGSWVTVTSATSGAVEAVGIVSTAGVEGTISAVCSTAIGAVDDDIIQLLAE